MEIANRISEVGLIALLLVLVHWMAQILLERINRRHVHARAGAIPEPFRDLMDEEGYAKSIEYTLAKSKLAEAEMTWSAGLVAIALASGWLPWAWERLTPRHALWEEAAFLFGVGIVWEILSWPLAWRAQFHLEERFGFNTTTPAIWWADRAKGLVLAAVLGYPVLLLILFLAERAGSLWWVWAWASLACVQLVLMLAGPIFIMPLFNRFTSLPAGSLRQRLFQLAERVGFPARDIQVMDGSRRSRHSNAFFTGLGRFRKIVLFDTLIDQLRGEELEAVLAHEIGHYKKGHIPKLLASSTLMLLAGFYVLSLLASQDWFFRAFGFQSSRLAPALMLFALLSGTVFFWISPLINYWSRRFEYAADAYAAGVMGGAAALISALRGLNKKNLSNLTPHPLYSRFYYSHPTLLEREKSLLVVSHR